MLASFPRLEALKPGMADVVKRNLRKLPRVAAPLEIRKLALYDLANALANVDGPQERAVVEACAAGEIVGRLGALLIDADSAQGLEEVTDHHSDLVTIDLQVG